MRTYFRSFAGGEVASELFARGDTTKLQTGVALARNFITLPSGPLRARPGTVFFGKSKLGSAGKMRWLPFRVSVSTAYVIEFGAGPSSGGYIRLFNADGTPVTYSTPAAFVTSKTCTFTGGSPNVACTGHGLTAGLPVTFTTTGTLPTIDDGTITGRPMLAGERLWVHSVVDANTFTVRLTETGGSSTSMLTAGTPTITMHRSYLPGEIVSSGGANYYSIAGATDNYGHTPPNATWWHPLPMSPNLLEIPTTYIADNLQFVRHFSSNDVMTLLHEDHPPRELRRYPTRWALQNVAFASLLSAPANLAGTATEAGVRVSVIESATPTSGSITRLRCESRCPFATGATIYGSTLQGVTTYGPGFFRVGDVQGEYFDVLDLDGSSASLSGSVGALTGAFKEVPVSSALTNTYCVTATDADGLETQASSTVTVTNNLFTNGAYNTLTWSPVTGAVRYHVYKQVDGLFGWIASTDAGVLTLRDDNLEAQMDRTLPRFDTTFSSGPYPEAGCYHEQRRAFARAQNIWMTRTGTESDMSYSVPVKADDRLDLPLAATEFCRIQHLVSAGELIALSDSTEFVVVPVDSEVLAPGRAMARARSFIGASHVRPAIANDRVLYAAARGGHLRELSYQSQGYANSDLSVFAPHLFDNRTLIELSVAKAPYPIIWAVSSSGALLGLTYMPEQEVVGWHQHTLPGTVRSVTTVPYGTEDRTFLAVERTVAGVTETHFCHMAPFALGAVADSVYVDLALLATNAPAGVLSGLAHLAGTKVSILADGIVLPQQIVNTAGQVSLPATKATYSKVVVGVPIDARVQTLPLFMQIEALAQGRSKTVGNIWARTQDSAPFRAGPDEGSLVPSDAAAAAIRGLPVAQTLTTKVEQLRSAGAWTPDAQILFVHSLPLPLTITGLTFEVAFGD